VIRAPGGERQRGATSGRRPLRAFELAEAAVLADVSVALCLLGWLLPFGGGVLVAMAAAPMASLGVRHRPRAVIAGGVAGATVSLLLGGTGLAVNVIACAVIGGLVGLAVRRGWTRRTTVAVAGLVLSPPIVAILLGLLAVLSSLRKLLLVQVTNSWRGTAKLFRRAGLNGPAHVGDRVVAWVVVHWPAPVAAGIVLGLLGATWLAYTLARPVLAALDRAASTPEPPVGDSDDDRPPCPVPVELVAVRYRYPGAPVDALAGVSAEIGSGGLVAVVGPNGSGKSTLTRILAGRHPTAGTVERPGSPGLGRLGGTALVFQRPETQILGVRVSDDVVWGLPPGHGVDVAATLEMVGLGAHAGRDTSTLSGGELQRLALGAALARRPRLLLSDETTAMVDPEGRHDLIAVLEQIAAGGTTVVHVTHRPEETRGADRVLQMAGGRIVTAAVPRAPRLARATLATTPLPGGTVRLVGVGHTYARRSPWEQRALTGVDLQLDPGEGLLIVGRNGSGKSTLAWILAGLLRPSAGEATLDGIPLDLCVGEVGLAFQHARLQLLRSFVRADVRAASGTGDRQADAALDLVGLDPREFGPRPVDRLSGGEQRRVALAGLVAARPRVLVLDEPFAGMDADGREDLIAVLGRLRDETGATVVIVSHDTEGADRVVERAITLDGGAVVADSVLAARRRRAVLPPSPPADRPSSAPRRRSSDPDVRFLRVVPGDSPVHHLWAGTKLIALVAIAVALSFQPTWPAIGLMAGLVLATAALARIPLGALPRVPRWLWLLVAFGAWLELVSGGPPNVHVAGMAIGLGALRDWARVTALGLTILGAAALVSWTTALAGIAPALRRLGAPLRWTRLPIDEWSAAVGLSLRCIPLLLEEVRILTAVMRLRATHRHSTGRRSRIGEVHRLLVATLVVALRRAGEFAAAIDARGGLGVIAADADGPGVTDGVALVVVAAAVVAAFVLR
jgi:energy-coupling factor transporter ATP-binding protein EcfA2/energy-coupling factor transporter transmembrane protein EcfT